MTVSPLSLLDFGAVRVVLLDFAGHVGPALTSTARDILGREELALWRGFGLERKRMQWLAGRLVAKLALRDGLARSGASKLPHICDLPVLPVTGRSGPVLSPIGGALSLSHSGTLAAAVYSAAPIGVDIEGVRAFRDSARSFVLSPHEARFLRDEARNDSMLTRLWAIKEAVLKARHAASLTEMRGILWHGWGQRGAARVTDHGRPVTFVRAGLWLGSAIAVAAYDQGQYRGHRHA